MGGMGARFKTIRNSLGLNQREMGRLLGVHAITVKNWERGYSPVNLTEENVLMLEGIGVNTKYLYGIGAISNEGKSWDQVVESLRELQGV